MFKLFKHKHRWGTWTVTYRYIDTSWGFNVPSCTVVSTCTKCGILKEKEILGTSLRVGDTFPGVTSTVEP